MRVCKICDKEYTLNKSGVGYKYCSQQCADEARRIRNRERWREANPGWNDGANKVCEWCGKSYEVKPKYASQSRFCSDECQQTWYSRQKGHKSMEEYLKELEAIREHNRQELIKDWDIQEWEYIGGYTKGNSDIQMKCLHCNRVITIKIDDIVSRKTWECTSECIEEVKYEQEQERLLEIKQRKKEQWKALPIKECTVCGIEFKSWQPTQVTCSKRCSRTHANRKKKAYDKATKSQVEVIDNDITVEGLFKRDKGICHLCGSECNPKDFEIRDGAFVVGKTYPSIDHIIPRSKNGVHSWENVKLAHHYCNTIKNDHEDEEVITRRIMEMAL